MRRRFVGIALAAGLLLLGARAGAGQEAPPRILYETSARAIEYQLGRLTNAELVRVERKNDDVKYRPVYVALLTRKGLGREYFDEALAALMAIDKATSTEVLLDGLTKIPADDLESADRLLRVLLGQPAQTLRQQRPAFERAIERAGSPFALRGAYGGVMRADGSVQPAWDAATKRAGDLAELLRSAPYLGASPDLADKLFDPIAGVLAKPSDSAARAAALAALGWTRRDAAAFRLLAREVLQPSDEDARAAAISSLLLIPQSAWPAGEIEPLARALVTFVNSTPAERRGAPVTADATHLAEKLSEALSDEPRRAIRRDLRATSVQIVRIETVPEQMMFDLRWFAVEAGKPVQIVLYNRDAMPHNLLVTRPGSAREIGTAAASMTPSADPKAKPYVPDSPLVLEATRLLNWNETERLTFKAPKEAGEYPFLCTFPGHWVRMYGVMLVVDNLETWEAKRTPPNDPMTGKPFTGALAPR